MDIAEQCPDLKLQTDTSVYYQDILSCNETKCYFTAENASEPSDIRVCKFDFENRGNVSYTEHDDTDYKISDIATVDTENIIVSAFYTGGTPNRFVFYRFNHTVGTISWAVTANTFGKCLKLFCKQSYTYNDCKYFNMLWKCHKLNESGINHV